METSTSVRKKAGRKLKRIITKKLTVMSIINLALDKCEGSLKEVAKVIDYRYTSLWGVYRGERPMPPLTFQKLCHFTGVDSTIAFDVFIEQCVLFDNVILLKPKDEPPKKAKPAKRRIRKKAVPKEKTEE